MVGLAIGLSAGDCSQDKTTEDSVAFLGRLLVRSQVLLEQVPMLGMERPRAGRAYVAQVRTAVS